jgi:hypothetical protein
MTPEQIREAACAAAYDAAKQASGSWLDGFEAIYRAGMAAGRAEAQRALGSLADPEAAGDVAALLRRLESDPVEAAKFLADVLQERSE